MEKLKISYDGLKPVEKELFLDIACFFRKKDIYEAMEILDACGFYPVIGVRVLIEKALITVSEHGRFDMHDLVQEMAHYIVRGEHPNNPEKQSRLWRNQDIEDICSRNETTINKKIEAIQCNACGCNPFNFNMLVSNMKKLRFLDVSLFPESPFPESPFPESFQPTKLVNLRMDGSLQKKLWKGYKYLPYLKMMKLYDMNALVRTPDISGLPCLEVFTLEKCKSLKEIHQSLGNHSSLVHVSISSCEKLLRFPTIVKMDKLKILTFSECKALTKFPEIKANMDSLALLRLMSVGIEVLPSSVGKYCTNLIYLGLEYCSRFKCIDDNFCALKGLKYFELFGCRQFEKFPKDLFNENVDGLGLSLDSTSLKHLIPLPRFLGKLTLMDHKLKDGDIPTEIGELSDLRELDICSSNITRLHFSLSKLAHLKLLKLNGCKNLFELPHLPSNLAILKANWCALEVIEDDAYKRCKWLCSVSILGDRTNITGGTRLLDSMLQGKTIESRCMTLQLNGSEIPNWFEPRLVRGGRCRKQLPENWYNHFSGFLFCVVFDNDNYGYPRITTCMKHEIINDKHKSTCIDKSDVDDSTVMNDSQDYGREKYWEEIVDDWTEKKKDGNDGSGGGYDDERKRTWVGYIPFGSLRNTLWWDQTSIAFEIQFESSQSPIIRGCGCKIIHKRNETTNLTNSSSSSEDVSNDYTCGLKILHDSDSTFKFQIVDDE